MDPSDPSTGVTFPPLEGEREASEGAGVGLVRLARDIWLRPARAMEAVCGGPRRLWLAPLVVLVGVSVLGALVAAPASREHRRQELREQFESSAESLPEGQSVDEMVEMATTGLVDTVTTVAAVVAGVVGPVVSLLAVAAVLHLLGTVAGGQQTFTQALAVTSWARLPLAAGGLLLLAYMASGHFDPSPKGLSGLVAQDARGAVGFARPLLAQMSLWNLWYLGLLALGVRAASHVSRAKAVVLVLVLVAIEVGLGLAWVAVGQAFRGG